MNLPPIPPNCRYFIMDEGVAWFVHFDNLPEGSRSRTPLNALTPWDRHIAACTARCAWLDEAERRGNNEIRRHFTDAIGSSEANRNADAWKLWGESST